MSDSETVSLDTFRVLVERLGLELPEEELERLRPMFELHLERTRSLHEVELDAEDLAVMFPPLSAPEA